MAVKGVQIAAVPGAGRQVDVEVRAHALAAADALSAAAGVHQEPRVLVDRDR